MKMKAVKLFQAVIAAIMLGFASQATAVYQGTPPNSATLSGPEAGSVRDPLPWVPGEMIVKYRATVTTPIADLISDQPPNGAHAALKGLHKKHRVHALRQVYKDRSETPAARARRLNNIRERFPARAARARALAEPPDLSRVYVLGMPSDADVEAAVAEFRKNPDVEYAQPNYLMKVQMMPNDPYFGTSGSWQQPEEDLWGLQAIGAPTAWNVAQGQSAIVAVVDTGVDIAHPDLAANTWVNEFEIPGNGIDDDGNGYVDDVNGWNSVENTNDTMDRYGHGTHVAGTIAAVGNNGTGIIGVAPGAKIMVVKGLGDSGFGSFDSLGNSILYAAENGADVINNSWACTNECPSQPAMEEVVRHAHDLGTVIVFAAGNSTKDTYLFSPQNMPETITVSAQTPANELAYFSNYGRIDMAAPGGGDTAGPPAYDPFRNILSLKSFSCNACVPELTVGDKYWRQAGTSMAAPHVAGAAAVVMSLHPELTNEQVRQALRRSIVDLGTPGYDASFGYGGLNLANALQVNAPLAALITSSPITYTGVYTIPVQGMADGPNFSQWELSYAPGENPGPLDWSSAGGSTTAVSGGLLMNWDISAVPDGTHTLRLVAANAAGETFEDRRRIVIDQVAITGPAGASGTAFFRPGDSATLTGTVNPSNFQSYTVTVKDGAGNVLPDAAVTLAGGGAQRVVNGPLATWNTAEVAPGNYTLQLTVTLSNGGTSTETKQVLLDNLHNGSPQKLPPALILGWYPIGPEGHLTAADVNGDGAPELLVGGGSTSSVLDSMGVNLPGWPQNADPTAVGAHTWQGTAAGDIDGDGQPEVVVVNSEGMVFVWKGDGTLLPGWPKSINHGYYPYIAIDDLDGDGINEIIIIIYWYSDNSVGTLNVLDANGNQLPGWPLSFDGLWVWATAPAIGDIDGNGKKEIVFADYGGNRLLAYRYDGTAQAGWPVTISSVGDPVLADLDGNGTSEVICGSSDGKVHVLKGNGSYLSGWPVTPLPGNALSIRAVAADVDNDGRPEVVASGSTSTTSPEDYLFVWNADGTLRTGWPVVHSGVLDNTQMPPGLPIVADVDGDGNSDIVVSFRSPAGNITPLHAYRADGALIGGFPKAALVSGTSQSSPVVADLDKDGLLELAWIDYDRNLYVWDLPSRVSDPQPWPMYRQGAQRTARHVSVSLRNLTVSAGALSPTFSPAVTTYTDSVTNSVTSIDVTATLVDTRSSMTINGTAQASGVAVNVPLNLGTNVIQIVVKTAGVASKTYTITVTRADGWRLNPALPAGMNGIAYGGARFVAVGSGGTIVTSSDGRSWATRTSGTSNALYGVAYGGSGFVAVGAKGKILTSPDGAAWTNRISGLVSDLNGVAYGGSGFVAVGASGRILTSTDGIAWVSRQSGTNGSLNGVSFSGTLFAVAGASGLIRTSPNGVTWTAQTSNTTNTLNGITHAGSQFVAVGKNGTILTSVNGISWVVRSSGTTVELRSASFGGGRHVAVGINGTVRISADGAGWSSQTSGTSRQLNGVSYGVGTFVAVGASGTTLYSVVP